MTNEQNNEEEYSENKDSINALMRRIEMDSDKRWEERNIKKREEELFHTNVIERAERLGFKRAHDMKHEVNYIMALNYIDKYYKDGAADKDDII
jgi:uncharacterized protein YcaQ